MAVLFNNMVFVQELVRHNVRFDRRSVDNILKMTTGTEQERRAIHNWMHSDGRLCCCPIETSVWSKDFVPVKYYSNVHGDVSEISGWWKNSAHNILNRVYNNSPIIEVIDLTLEE
jgi:hypothetical protein